MRISAFDAAWKIPLALGLAVQHHLWCVAQLTCHWILEDVPLEESFEALAHAEFDIYE